MRKIIRKTVGVLGSQGMLGSAVAEYFSRKNYRVIMIDRNNFDVLINSPSELKQIIKKVDVIINCIGLIKPTIGHYTPEQALEINGLFPWNLARMCNSLHIKCLHIATDCVFSGKKGYYVESDLVDADDLYGLTKAAGDTNLCMTLRTSVIGEELGNSRSLLEWIKSQRNQQVNGFENHRWNGVTTVELARCMETIIGRGWYSPGIYHIFSPEILNKYQLLKLVSNVYGLNLKITKTKAQMAVDRSLRSEKSLVKKLKIRSIKEQIMEMKDFFSNSDGK